MDGIRERGEAQGLDLHVQGLPMAFHVSMPSRGRDITTFGELKTIDRAGYEQLVADLLEEGVWVARRGVWYVSAAHSEADIDEVLERIDRAMARSNARADALP